MVRFHRGSLFSTSFAWGPFSFPTLTARPRSPSATSLRRSLATAGALSIHPNAGLRQTAQEGVDDASERVGLLQERQVPARLDYLERRGARQALNECRHGLGRGILIVGSGDGEARHPHGAGELGASASSRTRMDAT